MTRPVFEPSLTRADAAQAWGSRQLFRRPAPQSGGATESAVLFSWNFDVSDQIDPQTWTSVARAVSGDQHGYFEEAWISESPGTFSIDFDTGEITNLSDANYIVTGWAQFGDDPVVGESRLVGIQDSIGGIRYISEVTSTTTTGIGTQKIPVTTGLLIGFGSLFVNLQVWHDHATSIQLIDARLFATKLEPTADGEFLLRP